MYITRIFLKQYRNYGEIKLTFNQLGNVIIGKNAQGKTNIIESIYVASYGKSFRAKKDIELIQFTHDFYRIKMHVQCDQEEQEITITCLSNGKKQIKLNGLPLQKAIDLIGTVRVVIFSQEDLKLLRGSPQDRRNQLDRLLSLIDYKYKHRLLQYNKVLKQRNALLKQFGGVTSKQGELDFWDETLSKLGAQIMYDRMKYLQKLSDLIRENHDKMSSSVEIVSVHYESSVILKHAASVQEIMDDFKRVLKLNFHKDIKLRYTSVGPHKDDIQYLINDYDARKYASQGQQRTLVISQKIAEIEMIHSIYGDYPIFLLDDVMSELDVERQSKLLEMIKACQTVITTTDLNGINIADLDKWNIYEIDQGALRNFGGQNE